MAIDYVVNYPCDAKKTLGTAGLLDLYQAAVAYAYVRKQVERGDERPSWTQVAQGENGEVVEEAPERGLRQKTNRLIEFTSGCEGCPANARGGPLGCFGRINYPIDAALEEYVADRFEKAGGALMESPARIFFAWIAEGPVDGRAVQYLRAGEMSGVRFFERETPIPVLLPSPAPAELTTDHIFEMLFFAFPQPEGELPYTVPSEALHGYEAALRYLLEDEPDEDTDVAGSRSRRQLAGYLKAISVARGLEVDVVLD